jgi:hypothetical protein
MTDKDLAAFVHSANKKLAAEIKESAAKIKGAQITLSHAVQQAKSAGLKVGYLGGWSPEDFDRVLGDMVNSTINVSVSRVTEL